MDARTFPVWQVADAEGCSAHGEVCVSPEAWALVRSMGCEGEARGDGGHVLLKHVATGDDAPRGIDEEMRRSLLAADLIELQRKLMQQRDDSPVGDEAEEVAWYAEQTKRLDRFKQALNALRLESDEFALRVPGEWMQPGARRLRNTVECTLRVNAQSQMTFVPAAAASGSPGSSSSGGGGSCSLPGAEDAALASVAGRPRVFFIDELRSVRCATGAVCRT